MKDTLLIYCFKTDQYILKVWYDLFNCITYYSKDGFLSEVPDDMVTDITTYFRSLSPSYLRRVKALSAIEQMRQKFSGPSECGFNPITESQLELLIETMERL